VKRVVVLGAGGAGKTRLANELSRRTGLPVVHLHRLRSPREVRRYLETV
jgi:adenylate kinase family enzyme